MNKQTIAFVVKSSLIFAFSYLLAGGIAYAFITKQFYVGDNSIFTAYLRSESNITEWAHTNVWLIPGLMTRAVLISLVILPFIETLKKFSTQKSIIVVFALLFVLTHIAAAAPSPSNIEGFVYMKPALFTLKAFVLTQPEMLVQCFLYAVGLSWLIKKPAY